MSVPTGLLQLARAMKGRLLRLQTGAQNLTKSRNRRKTTTVNGIVVAGRTAVGINIASTTKSQRCEECQEQTWVIEYRLVYLGNKLVSAE